tara:strand:+ start:301 stop:1107 length:807 start_codon:yes stop_codon:yes gene_type:complete
MRGEHYFMDKYEEFLLERANAIRHLGNDSNLKKLGVRFVRDTAKYKYSYNFDWMGRPIIQFPQDIVAMQELIWRVKPDLIIETGIAHGGSLTMSASMLALLDYSDAVANKNIVDPLKSNRKVLGIDIEIRKHNRLAIERHPMSHLIQMIQGSSIDPEIVQEVQNVARGYKRILVCLDSNHTHEHVLSELQAYAPLASLDSYCVVFDTIIEDLPVTMFPDRPWGIGNNPKTAVKEFLESHPEFEIDEDIQNKLLISVAPNGYLKRVSND